MRMCWARWITAFAFFALFVVQSFAVEPDEVLDDPILEERARILSQELRCVVCQGENIDASHASVAKDLRIVLREKLVEGMSDDEVLEFMRVRYGDYILMKPRFSGSGALVWLAGPIMFLFGLVLVVLFIRRSGSVGVDDADDEI